MSFYFLLQAMPSWLHRAFISIASSFPSGLKRVFFHVTMQPFFFFFKYWRVFPWDSMRTNLLKKICSCPVAFCHVIHWTLQRGLLSPSHWRMTFTLSKCPSFHSVLLQVAAFLHSGTTAPCKSLCSPLLPSAVIRIPAINILGSYLFGKIN